ncbi:MAG TPA: hypothetical protein VJN88_01150 [Ktedonobacterales bacterium]|nr:hypothetical protein [Ktedonobacterales bacterium]
MTHLPRRSASSGDFRTDANAHVDNILMTPIQAENLQKAAEQWQALLMRQQEIALQLQSLATNQRVVATQWGEMGDQELAEKARELEITLHGLVRQALLLEERTLMKIDAALTEVDSALR